MKAPPGAPARPRLASIFASNERIGIVENRSAWQVASGGPGRATSRCGAFGVALSVRSAADAYRVELSTWAKEQP